MKGLTPKPSEPERRRSGRPTKEQAAQLTEQIIDVATPLFLEDGFEATSIDAIVGAAFISKQTFYARFASKEALFACVVKKRLNTLLVPFANESLETDSIEAVLVQIGSELVRRGLTPNAITLDRLITTEGHQFPELAAVYRESHAQVRQFIMEVFTVAMQKGQIRRGDASFLAQHFQNVVAYGLLRDRITGPKSARLEKSWREILISSVRLFLHGCVPRSGESE